MFELWARKRAVNGVGSPFEWIFNFDNEQYKYTAIDTLDREIYQEAMVVEGERLVMYREFPKIYVNKRVRRRNDKDNKQY